MVRNSIYKFDFGPHEDYCKAHSIDGRLILPGMVSLGLASEYAIKLANEGGFAELRNIVWVNPVSPDTCGTLIPVECGERSLRIESRSQETDGDESAFESLSCAFYSTEPCEEKMVSAEMVRVLLSSSTTYPFYERIKEHGIDHAPELLVVDRVVIEKDRVVFSAVVDDLPAEREFSLSPALLNAAFGALLALGLFEKGACVVPMSIARMKILGRLQGQCIGEVKLGRKIGKTCTADIDFYDHRGQLVVMIRELSACQVELSNFIGGAPRKILSIEGKEKSGSGRIFPVSSERAIPSYLRRLITSLVNKELRESDDNKTFMDLGLTSVQLLDLARQIERDLGVEMYPTFFFEYQTIMDAASYLAKDGHAVDKAKAAFGDSEEGKGSIPGGDPGLELDRPASASGFAGPVSANARDGDIAIIGMGCRFAQTETPEEFWRHILDARDLVGTIPSNRWDVDRWYEHARGAEGKSYCRWGSFLDDVSGFDAALFHISPNEAASMDPQLRVFLEVIYRTLEDAGYEQRIRGSRTGLYVGACFREYMDEMLRLHKQVGPYDLTGCASTFLSNRASYVFDLRGPSMTVDVACSSSLVALHLACKALQSGEADMALAGGVNLLLSPLHYLHFSALQALSPTGRCHTFDERADGYVPGEGVAAVLLKPLDRALADGDRIYAVVKGSAVNHSGRSNSPTAPSLLQQADVLSRAWTDAGIDPATLTYIEAHGTGTKLGDPIEIGGINKAFAEWGTGGTCWSGSVKANIGHTEGTAGLAGVIKAVQMLRYGQIPRMPNFERLNPLLPLSGSRLAVNTRTEAWERNGQQLRRAGVSSFGIGGGYSHVVLEEAPQQTASKPGLALPAKSVFVFPLSANTKASLHRRITDLHAWLQSGNTIEAAILAAYLQHCPQTFEYRVAFVAEDTGSLKQLVAQATRASEIASEHQRLFVFPTAADALPAAMLDRIVTEANAWLSGETMCWQSRCPTMLELGEFRLAYPFDRQAYWFSSEGTVSSLLPQGSEMLRPLLEGTQVRTLGFSAPVLQGSHSFLQDHRLLGEKIVPGVVHLEIFAQAIFRLRGALPLSIRDLYWLTPLRGERVEYELDCVQASNDEFTAVIRLGETEAATACLRTGALVPRPEPIPIDRIMARAERVLEGEAIYLQVEQLGLELGRYFRTIAQVFGTQEECLARLSDTAADVDAYLLPPSIFDSINHCLRGLIASDGQELGLAIPYFVKTVVCYEPAQSARFIYARRAGDSSAYDIFIGDESGRVLAALWGFHPREYQRKIEHSALTSTPASYVAAENLSEVTLARLEALMSEVTGLAVHQLQGRRDLSNFGVDSVAVAQFTRKVNQTFGLELTPALFFEHKSLASYAEHLCVRHRSQLETVAGSAVAGQGKMSSRVPVLEPVSPGGMEQHEEEIAIIGIAGRFPGSDDVDQLWANLEAGVDLVSEIPLDRFDWRRLYGEVTGSGGLTTKYGAFMDEIDRFAGAAFGISRREAELMDPQQRLFLETVRELLLEAGYTREAVEGVDAGVFVGVVNNEYYELLNETGVDIEAHTSTGMARCVLANRVSHHYDFCGPSEVVDTACSSSLVAVHRAVQSLRAGECSMAIAGGVNLLLTPKLFISFSKAGMLSPDGRCKTFDAAANGYVRGEGCGAVLLKPLDKALADGDFIYGVVRGSGVNHGGRVNSLTVPNPQAQANLISNVLRSAGLTAAALSYVEAHGTGTPLGDPIEINGLKRVFSQSGSSGMCGIGSIKSNMGHLEGAAGIAGMLKVVLALQHRILPPSLHVQSINPQIDLKDTPLYIQDRKCEWRRNRSDCVAGISSFGFGGVNAHVLVGGFETRAATSAPFPGMHSYPILLSADSEGSLRRYVSKLLRYLREPGTRYSTFEDTPAQRLANIAYTLQVGREQDSSRVGFLVSDIDELIGKLNAIDSDAIALDDLRRRYPVQTTNGRFTGDGLDWETLAYHVSHADWDAVVALWHEGGNLPWRELLIRGVDPFPGAHRIPLPSPPLTRERYWLPQRVQPSLLAAATAAVTKPVLTHPFFSQ